MVVVSPGRCTSVGFQAHRSGLLNLQKPTIVNKSRIRLAKSCKARQEDRGEKGGIDWDAEWTKAKQKLPEVESNTSTRRNVRTFQRDKIREQESLVLDVFSGENFFKVAGGLVVAILFIFVVVIGPPSR